MLEYKIQGETLNATADKIRHYLNQGGYKMNTEMFNIFNPKVTVIEYGSIPILYYEFIDDPFLDDQEITEGQYGSSIGAYSYLPNGLGELVPVVYLGFWATDFEQPYYYTGTTTIDGELCDRWLRIDADTGETNVYNWEGTTERNIYTVHVVEEVEQLGLLSPTEFPQKIEEIYNAGLKSGQNNDALHDYAPLIVQAQTEPASNSNFGALEEYYDVAEFLDCEIGDITYNYTDHVGYSTETEGGTGSLTIKTHKITVQNNHPFLYLKVYITGVRSAVNNSTGVATKTTFYLQDVVPPKGSVELTNTQNMKESMPSWTSSITYLGWHSTQPL